jgi:PAS domain S-box-containing protein
MEGPEPASAERSPAGIDYRLLFQSAPGSYLVLRPDLEIVDASEAYLRAVEARRDEIVGRPLFEAFPVNPGEPNSTGVANLRRSLERVVRERVPDHMAIQKYDILVRRGPDPTFEARFWSPVNIPVTGPDGELRYILHRVEDVTEFVRADGAAAAKAIDADAREMYQRGQILQDANLQLRRANAALAEARDLASGAERRAREILESISDAFMTLDRDWRIEYINREAARLLKRPERELLGKSIVEAFPDVEGSVFHEMFVRAELERIPVAEEAYFAPLDAWFSVRVYPSSEGFSVYFLDVTEERRSQEDEELLNTLALRIGEAETLDAGLHVMLEEICRATGWAVGEVWTPDADGARLQRASSFPGAGLEGEFGAASEAMTFAPGEGLIGRVWREGELVWCPDVRRLAGFRRASVAESAGIRSALAMPIRAADTIVAVLAFFNGEARADDARHAARLPRAAEYLERLFERKRSESVLRELNRELAERDRVLAMAGRIARLGGWSIDLADRIVHWSDEVCELHDAPPGTRVTLDEGLSYFLPEWREMVAEHVRACSEEGIPYDLEVEKVSRTGRRFWVRTIGEAVRGEDGTITRIQGAFQDVTQQRRAQAIEVERRRRYRMLVEQSLDGIFLAAPDGSVLSANPAACRMLGYTEEEICRLGRDGIFDLNDAVLPALLDQRGQPGQSIGEATMVRRDGTRIPVEITAQLFRDIGGEDRTSIFVRDVSDRRRGEAALKESEEKLRQIAENIREVFWMFDPDFTQAVYVSPAYEELWGRPVQEVFEDAATFLDAVHPDDRAAVSAAMREVREGVLNGVEFRVVRPDGEIRWVRSRGYPVLDASGDVYRVAGTTEDITSQKQTESERDAAEAHYRHLFKNAPYGIYALDAEGRFTELNPAAERIAGVSSTELMGKHFSSVITAADHAIAQDGFDRVISGESDDIEFDERIRRPSGEERLVRVTESAIRAGDRIIGTHGIARDITDEERREKSLRRAERLASVGTLIGGVAHELNNPLHAVRSFAELMLLDARTPEDREMLDIVLREADRAAKVVSDLRLIARNTQGGDAERCGVDVNDVVRHVVKLRRYPMETGNIAIVEDLASDLPDVLADRSEIEQVVLNLVVNAEHALSEVAGGDRKLTLRTRRTPTGASIHVVDTGPGIPAIALDRIFDPFFTTKAPGEGTGLGLSLVHKIVQEHEGQIHVESEPGRGTSFRIDLPRARLPEPTTPEEESEPSIHLRVLVVDDEPAIRLVSQRYLQRLGHTVETASDGELALRMLDADSFDVIVSDLRMPGLDGWDLLRRLRERADGLDRRIIFLTGDAATAQPGRIAAETGVPVLFKPIRLDELARAVEACHHARTTGGEPEEAVI